MIDPKVLLADLTRLLKRLEGDLRETEAPAFDPRQEFPSLRFCAFESDVKVYVAAAACIATGCATTKVQARYTKPIDVETFCKRFRKTLAPCPMHRGGSNPLL